MMVMENEFERQIEQLFAAEELAELWDEIMDAYSNDQIDKARTLLNQLLEENPDFSRAYLMLGNIALKEEDSEEAIMQFQRALDAASRILGIPNDVTKLRGDEYDFQHDPQARIYTFAMRHLLNLRVLREEWEEAYKLGKALLRFKNVPRRDELEMHTAVACHYLGKLDEADELYLQRQDNLAAQYNHALILLERGQWEDAILQLRRLALTPYVGNPHVIPILYGFEDPVPDFPFGEPRESQEYAEKYAKICSDLWKNRLDIMMVVSALWFDRTMRDDLKRMIELRIELLHARGKRYRELTAQLYALVDDERLRITNVAIAERIRHLKQRVGESERRAAEVAQRLNMRLPEVARWCAFIRIPEEHWPAMEQIFLDAIERMKAEGEVSLSEPLSLDELNKMVHHPTVIDYVILTVLRTPQMPQNIRAKLAEFVVETGYQFGDFERGMDSYMVAIAHLAAMGQLGGEELLNVVDSALRSCSNMHALTADELVSLTRVIAAEHELGEERLRIIRALLLHTAEIYSGRHRYVIEFFDSIMEDPNLAPDEKYKLCEPMVWRVVWTPYGEPLTEEELMEMLFVSDELLKIFYVSGALRRRAIVWCARTAPNKRAFLRKAFVKAPSGIAINTDLGVADALEDQAEDLPVKFIRQMIEKGLEVSVASVRRRFYQVGARIFGREYLERALGDRAKMVRNWARKQLNKLSANE